MNDYPRTYETDDQVVEAADRILRARYWEHVKLIAQEALDEHPGKNDDDGERDNSIHEQVDGSMYVIYTYRNLLVIRFTEHDDAYMDAIGDELKGDAAAIYQMIAFYAMREDVNDELQRLLDEIPDEDDAEDEEDEAAP